MSHAYLIAGARTPIGAYLGGLSPLSASDLGGRVIAEVLSRSGFPPEQIDEVIMGNVLGAGVGQAPARQAALKGGLPDTIPAVTVNKVCGSGLKAVMLADQAIRCGDASAIIAGGMECMSQAPHIAMGLRGGVKFGDVQLKDVMVFDGLTCSFNNCHMGQHAEHIAKKFNVTREDQDQFALASQQRAATAIKAGWFDQELVPVTVASRKGETTVSNDEGPRAETTLEGLAKLRPAFDREGTVTAGNASTLSDGAAAVMVCDEDRAIAASSALPRFKILAAHTSGTAPQDLFIAPVGAVQGALKKCGLSIDQIDLFEINEAFASQSVACQRELNIPLEKLNTSGGGISLGHPIGASGARVLVTLMYALQRTGQSRGVASLCLGGGNAVAMVIEAVN